MKRYSLRVFNGGGFASDYEVDATSYYVYNSIYEFRISNGSSTSLYTVVACYPVSMTAIVKITQL